MLKLKLQYFGHLMWRTDWFEKTLMLGKIEGGRKRGWQNEMVGWHHRLYGHEFDQVPGGGDGQGSLVCYSPWGWKDLDTTERLNWTELNISMFRSFLLSWSDSLEKGFQSLPTLVGHLCIQVLWDRTLVLWARGKGCGGRSGLSTHYENSHFLLQFSVCCPGLQLFQWLQKMPLKIFCSGGGTIAQFGVVEKI